MFYNEVFGLYPIDNRDLLQALFFLSESQIKLHEGRDHVIFMFVTQVHSTASGT